MDAQLIDPSMGVPLDFMSSSQSSQPESDIAKVLQYKEASALLNAKCAAIQRDTERLIKRLHVIKKMQKRREIDVTLIKARLDMHGDGWRMAQPDERVNRPGVRIGRPLKPQKLIKEKVKEDRKSKLARKKLRDKEKDPNAPKRPPNPFLQFCQEQRALVRNEMTNELQPGAPEITKQELSRKLASKWRELNEENKQVYVGKYETSKQKYTQDMISYKKDNENKQNDGPVGGSN